MPFKKTSSQETQVKEADTENPVMLDQDLPDVDMLVWSINSSQVSPGTQDKDV